MKMLGAFIVHTEKFFCWFDPIVSFHIQQPDTGGIYIWKVAIALIVCLRWVRVRGIK